MLVGFLAAPAALSRGYNILAMDLPGQGLTPDMSHCQEARADRGVGAVVDFAVTYNMFALLSRVIFDRLAEI